MFEKFIDQSNLRAVSICPIQYYTRKPPSYHHGLIFLITTCNMNFSNMITIRAWALKSALFCSVLLLCGGHISQWSSGRSFPLLTLSLTHWLRIPAVFAILKIVQNQCAEFEGRCRQAGGYQSRTSSEPLGTHSGELSSLITLESQRVGIMKLENPTLLTSLYPIFSFLQGLGYENVII